MAKKPETSKEEKKSRPTYSAEEKAKILGKIEELGGAKTRGVLGKVAEEFGVSYITLRNWTGKGTPGKGKKKKSGSVGDDFNSLVEQIKEKKAELIDLIERLKTAI